MFCSMVGWAQAMMTDARCQLVCASVGSTFASLAACRCSTPRPPTTYVGIKISCVLNLGHWRDAALDDIFCNAHVDWIAENVLQVPSFGVPMGCYTSDFPRNSGSVVILRPRFVRHAYKLYTHWNVKSKLAGPKATFSRRTQTKTEFYIIYCFQSASRSSTSPSSADVPFQNPDEVCDKYGQKLALLNRGHFPSAPGTLGKFSGWHAHTLGSKIRRRDFFLKRALEVRRSRVSIACAKVHLRNGQAIEILDRLHTNGWDAGFAQRILAITL